MWLESSYLLEMTSLDVYNEWLDFAALSLCRIRTFINKKMMNFK